MIGHNSEVEKICDRATTINAQIARLIYDARTQAGLSQTKLAQIIDTTQSVISRLENAEYKGHSLSMLSRIARATGSEVKIELVPRTKA
ncbi:MAG: helix-turn-helix transcriptional regulator [Pleurocapsa sp. MO_226.B13]|nr:helix-turn-helix transcriptional regulator [Pleurocapsa sp. MO_226.B13]